MKLFNVFKKNIDNKTSAVDLQNYISFYNNTSQANLSRSCHIDNVIKNRYLIAYRNLPVRDSIKIVTNLILGIDLACKSLIADKIIENPLINLFNGQNISLLHSSYEDFMCSLIRNYICIDGVVYLLKVQDLNGNLERVEIVDSTFLSPLMNQGGIVSSYYLTNFAGIQSLKLDLDLNSRAYIANYRNKIYILHASDIVFESRNNLQFSPLYSIAQHVSLYEYAVERGIALNQKSATGGILFVPVDGSSQEAKDKAVTQYSEQLKGVSNTGNVAIVPIAAIGDKDKTNFMKIGNIHADYKVHEDIELSKKSIYQGFGIPLTIVNQDASYAGNQLESMKQLYELKIIPELQKISKLLQKWIFSDIDHEEYVLEVNKSSIDVFKEIKVKYVTELTGILDPDEQRKELGFSAKKTDNIAN